MQRGRGTARGGLLASRVNMTRTIVEHLGAFIDDVTLSADPMSYPAAAVEHVVPIASYSWLDKSTPTISVPGGPAVWVDRNLPLRCQQDTGMVFINQAAFRCPDSPLTPLVECVRYWQPTFDFSAMDIVTDRNNLRKLLSWAQGSVEEFRIDLQRAGKGTVLFMRWQPQTREISGPVFVNSFRKAVTRVKTPSEGYHRIVSYDLGELNVLVRFEVDACYDTQSSSTVDDLVSLTNSLSLSNSASSSSQPIKKNGIEIIRSGDELVNQEDLVEVATRSASSRHSFEWLNKYPQLYLSNTPTFVVGFHARGTFTSIEKFTTDDTSNAEIKRARQEMQPGLNKLAVTLGLIRDKVLELTDEDATGDRSGRLLALVCQGRKLAIYERTEGPKLPENLLELFDY